MLACCLLVCVGLVVLCWFGVCCFVGCVCFVISCLLFAALLSDLLFWAG